MASFTKYFNLGFFNLGDSLNNDFSGQVEIDRWQRVDSQLFGLMSILGNGVINGWAVSQTGNFSVSISSGYGNINFIAARTNFPESIIDLSPNSVNYIYAKIQPKTRFTEEVQFTALTDGGITDSNFLLLAQVIVGATSIETIDNSIRQDITFIDLIREEIKNHKHRGGLNNPSKIDLTSEVKGQLSGRFIEDLDADKITTGTLDIKRMPLIDHNDLINKGILTHPQLDSFVKTLESNNKELFGEITTANLLQMILALKYIYEDPDSSGYDSSKKIDSNMINELSLIPGITSDSYIDFNNSTASINLNNHYIEGVFPSSGTSYFINYDTNLSWESAFFKENVTIANNSVALSFSTDNQSNILTIENFEKATANNQSLTSDTNGIKLFNKQTVITQDSADILSNSVALNVFEGFYSGKFNHKQNYRVQYVKEYAESQDWTAYDSFVLNVKCSDSIHGAVKIFFYDDNQNKSIDFTILSEDEITSNTNIASNNFETRVINISQISLTKIKGFVIYSDDTINPFSFFIDYINLQKAILLPEEGKIILRYSTAVQVNFYQIDWTSLEPSDSDIKVRVKSSNGTAFLPRATYTSYLNSGDITNLKGTDLEIEVTFHPDTNRIQSPILDSLRILILTDANIDGYTINTDSEFSRGDSNNTIVENNSVVLNSPIYVDSYYFCLNNSVNQIYQDNTQFTQAELGLFGNDAPISPNQIFKSVEDNGIRAKVTSSRFFYPKSVIRLQNRNFLVADTFNDRVLEIDETGNLVKGIGSVNYEHKTKLFPISCSLDKENGILYIVFSQKISFKNLDVSKIYIQNSTQSIQVQLVKNFDKILNLTTDELSSVNTEGQIVPIYLSIQNQGSIKNLNYLDSYIVIASSALSTGLDNSSIYYKAISNSSGMPLYVGPFSYVDGIYSPTCATKFDNNYVISNATVGVIPFTITSDIIGEDIELKSNAIDVIEYDKNNNVIFSTDKMKFSPFVPGRTEKISENTYMIAGLKPDGVAKEVQNFRYRNISGDKSVRLTILNSLNELFFGSTSPFVGAAILYDARSGSTTFEYISAAGLVISDIDIDLHNNFVIAESSFNKSGRIIKVDSLGNIIYTYGEGLFSVIYDVNVQIDGSLVIST